jgi:hypothetical protein
VTGIARRPAERVGERRRETDGLLRAQRVGRLVKIIPGGGFSAVDARSLFGHVEIDFHDPPLAPRQLDQRREPGFEAFAQPVAAGPQEDVLRGLHRDRAGPKQASVSALIAIPGGGDRAPVKAIMAAEPGVLSAGTSLHAPNPTLPHPVSQAENP